MNREKSFLPDLWARTARTAPWCFVAVGLLLARAADVRLRTAGWNEGRPKLEIEVPALRPKAQQIARGPIDQANFLMSHGRADLAAKVLLEALDRTPANLYLAVRLEEVLLAKGEWAAARRLLDDIGEKRLPPELVPPIQEARARFHFLESELN